MFSYTYKVYENNRLYFFKSLKEILFSFVQPRCPVRDRHIYLSISFKIDFCFPIYLSLIKYFMRIIFEKKNLVIVTQGIVIVVQRRTVPYVTNVPYVTQYHSN